MLPEQNTSATSPENTSQQFDPSSFYGTGDKFERDLEGDARVEQASRIQAEYFDERRDLAARGGDLPPLDPIIANMNPEACRKSPEMLTALLAHVAKNDVAVQGEKNETGFFARLLGAVKDWFTEKQAAEASVMPGTFAGMTEPEIKKLMHAFDKQSMPKIDFSEKPFDYNHVTFGKPVDVAQNIQTSFADLKALGIETAGNVNFDTVGVIDNSQLPPAPGKGFSVAEFNEAFKDKKPL